MTFRRTVNWFDINDFCKFYSYAFPVSVYVTDWTWSQHSGRNLTFTFKRLFNSSDTKDHVLFRLNDGRSHVTKLQTYPDLYRGSERRLRKVSCIEIDRKLIFHFRLKTKVHQKQKINFRPKPKRKWTVVFGRKWKRENETVGWWGPHNWHAILLGLRNVWI